MQALLFIQHDAKGKRCMIDWFDAQLYFKECVVCCHSAKSLHKVYSSVNPITTTRTNSLHVAEHIHKLQAHTSNPLSVLLYTCVYRTC
jgi:hypothetical protein